MLAFSTRDERRNNAVAPKEYLQADLTKRALQDRLAMGLDDGQGQNR